MSATRRRLWISAAALVLLVTVVFAPVRHHDFVTFDDHECVVDNPNAVSLLRWRI